MKDCSITLIGYPGGVLISLGRDINLEVPHSIHHTIGLWGFSLEKSWNIIFLYQEEEKINK